MSISSINNTNLVKNDKNVSNDSNEVNKSNEHYQYIWGNSKKTDNINAELNRVIGNDGVSNAEEAKELARLCIELKMAYNSGTCEYKKSDIEEVVRMVEKARRDFCSDGSKPDIGL
jgi:hypothetical protein